jgi:hypothetical protein
MRRRLWHAIARMMRGVRGRAVRSLQSNHGDGGAHRTASRAKFWAEFREGQREAESRTKDP